MIMKKERKHKMFIVIGVLLIFIGGIMIWFNISYSPTKADFKNDIKELISDKQLLMDEGVFSETDFEHLPVVVQKYIHNCGYIGTPRMSYMKMEYKNVAFMQGKNGPALTIDYTQYNFVKEPCRMALIDSCMFAVPFEGYDYYQNGIGGMKGVIAKCITLFDQKGKEMDKACLATYLAEAMFAPSILLQDNISFEEISEYEVKATITYKGETASGIFTFNEKYEMILFTTKDRGVTNPDGTMEYVPWSAICNEYRVLENGIKQPVKLQAVWNYPEGDFVYFDGAIEKISYGFGDGFMKE